MHVPSHIAVVVVFVLAVIHVASTFGQGLLVAITA
jgi:hypothetical protein